MLFCADVQLVLDSHEVSFLNAAVRVNETDTFADDENEEDDYFDFDDISEVSRFRCTYSSSTNSL